MVIEIVFFGTKTIGMKWTENLYDIVRTNEVIIVLCRNICIIQVVVSLSTHSLDICCNLPLTR